VVVAANTEPIPVRSQGAVLAAAPRAQFLKPYSIFATALLLSLVSALSQNAPGAICF
jgi:hypothetical protein